MSELSKEEILKRAQNENKGRDLTELEAGRRDTLFAVIMVYILGTILCVTEIFVGKGINYALYIVVTSLNTMIFVRRAIRKPVRENVINAVLFCTATALFLVAWVISLIKL